MAKQIMEYDGRNLNELEIAPHELIAFDNQDFEMPHPFLITKFSELIEGHEKGLGLRLIHCPTKEERKEWTIVPTRELLGLWGPNHGSLGERISNFEVIPYGVCNLIYVVESAYSGEEEILRALKSLKNEGMDFYAQSEIFESLKVRI